jgi:SAM-dependent methyltransferase
MLRCLKCKDVFNGPDWRCPRCGWSPVRRGPILVAAAPDHAEPGFDPSYFDSLFELECGNFWFRARNALIDWALRRYFPAARTLLEIGCGTGFVLSELQRRHPELEVTASELYVEGLSRAARRLPRARLLQLDARQLPFTEEFDVIGAFDVLEHIDEDEAVLAEMARAVKPGGGLLITVPQHPWLWSAADSYAYHRRRYTRAELLRKLEAAGLRALRCTSFVTLLLPAMLASRRAQRDADDFDPRREFAIPRWLNRLLEGVLGVERGLISAGLSLPVGGSLLIVAARA